MSRTEYERTELRLLGQPEGLAKKRARLSAVLVYPSSYSVGMDNLGFQGVYGLLASMPGVRCERSFFEPGLEGVSIESGLQLKEFDVVAFSVSYENDLVNVLKTLKASGIEPLASKRKGTSPRLIAGGVGAFMNPEPLSPFVDAVFLGEADEALGDIVEALSGSRAGDRESVLEALSSVPGTYVPSLQSPDLGGEAYAADAPRPGRRHVADLSETFCSSVVTSTKSHLGGMFLSEVARGCPRRCKFCAVSVWYSPLRFVPVASILGRVDAAIRAASSDAAGRGSRARRLKSVGLVGACVTEHPEVSALARALVSRQLRVSLSSVRADAGESELVTLVARSGTRTLTIAPEAGSPRLRQLLGKELEEERLFETVAAARDSDVKTLKVYFMVGLPDECTEDVDAIVSLTEAISSRFRAGEGRGSVTLSVSPFVPKASTSFQRSPMDDEKTLRFKLERLSRGLRKVPGVRFRSPSVRGALMESAISRGSWRTGLALYNSVFEGLGTRKAWEKAGLSFEDEACKSREEGSALPWDHLESAAAPPGGRTV